MAFKQIHAKQHKDLITGSESICSSHWDIELTVSLRFNRYLNCSLTGMKGFALKQIINSIYIFFCASFTCLKAL